MRARIDQMELTVDDVVLKADAAFHEYEALKVKYSEALKVDPKKGKRTQRN